jgi:glycosyl transferase family 25
MQVYLEVVNPLVSIDRRALMEREFDAAALKPNFFPAIYYRDMSYDYLLEYCLPTGPWGRTQPGHMATTISHMKVWERFLETDLPYCAVFEDDVFVAPDLGRLLNDMSWWPEDADIVKLEARRRDGKPVLLGKSEIEACGRKVRRLLSRHMGAAGYVITRTAAKKLIAAQPYDMVIDHILFNFNASKVAKEFVYYQVVPGLVTQGNEPGASSKMDVAEKIPKTEYWLRALRRGWLEVCYPLATYWQLISGSARIIRVKYSDQRIDRNS